MLFAVAVTALMMRGPFPILSTPFTVEGAIDYEDLGRGVRYVSDSGCPGVIWCQSNDAIDLTTFDEKVRGYEVCMRAMEGASAVLTLGVNGTKEEMLAEAAAVERLTAKFPHTKVAMIARPPDDGKTQGDIRDYYEALAKVAKRPVIIQSYVNETCPPPDVELLVDLARKYPDVYGYIKEESGGTNANARMAREIAAKPTVKAVYSAWGGWQWAFQSRRIGTEGLVTERCAYAPLLAFIWREMESGDRRRLVTPAFALCRLLIDQRDFPADGLRGYALHYFKRLGLFKTTMSRAYLHAQKQEQGTVVTAADRHAWKLEDLKLSPAQAAELDAIYDDMMLFLERNGGIAPSAPQTVSSELSRTASSEITLTKQTLRWLWGGFGFHNSESSMTGVMTDEFRDERIVKSFLEMAPTYSRVFAGYYNWTTNAMDRFADYYDATFRKCGTTLYVVPGRMPVITSDFDADRYAEDVAIRLDYVVHKRGCTKIRYYAISNELSVGPTYCWFPQGHWDDYKRIAKALQRAFARHDLDIGIMGPDSSGYERMQDIDWALKNVNEQTEVYCWHLYDRTHKPGDRGTYDDLYKAVCALSSKCCRAEKRLSVGEWGFTGAITPYGEGQMRDDGHLGFRKPGSVEANEAAIARVEMGLAILNGGAMHGITWTMVDYPDPFIREDGDSPREKAIYDLGRFSGAPHTLDIRYNKNGVFRWCDEERDYSAYPDLYTMGYLVKLFRKGARLLTSATKDKDLRVGAVTNPDGSCSIAVVNWGPKKTVTVRSAHALAKPLRVYEYDSAKPPKNDFNDLQPAKGTVVAKNNAFTAEVPARSLTFFTTDYTDRTPPQVMGVMVKDGRVAWTPADDPDHIYYRVYRDGVQVASTVATSVASRGPGAYTVRSVDRWGNCSEASPVSGLCK